MQVTAAAAAAASRSDVNLGQRGQSIDYIKIGHGRLSTQWHMCLIVAAGGLHYI